MISSDCFQALLSSASYRVIFFCVCGDTAFYVECLYKFRLFICTLNLRTWHPAMPLFWVQVYFRVIFVIHFVKGCSVQPASLPESTGSISVAVSSFTTPCIAQWKHIFCAITLKWHSIRKSSARSTCVMCIKMTSFSIFPLPFFPNEFYVCRLLFLSLVMLEWCNYVCILCGLCLPQECTVYKMPVCKQLIYNVVSVLDG